MLAANAKFDPWTSRSPAFGSEFDQFTHAFAVQAHEGITGDNALVDLLRPETARVVATATHSRLRATLAADWEDLADISDLPCFQGGTGGPSQGAEQQNNED